MKPSFDTDMTDAIIKAEEELCLRLGFPLLQIARIDNKLMQEWNANYSGDLGRRTYWQHFVPDKDLGTPRIAIFYDIQLCALAAGEVRSQEQLWLTAAESRPGEHLLKGQVVLIVTKIFELAALKKGMKCVFVDNVPFDSDLEKKYFKLGYSRTGLKYWKTPYLGVDPPLQKVLQESTHKRALLKGMATLMGFGRKPKTPAPP